MFWGLKRFNGSGNLHFITCSCYRRQALLASERRRDLFLVVLEQVRQRYGFVALGYVVMPEHFHLLISEPEKGDPSVVMQALKLGFARRVLPASRSHHGHQTKPTHVWQRRFYDYNVRSFFISSEQRATW